MLGYDPHMCLICVDLAKEKLTASERAGPRRMRVALDKEHVAEVEALLASAGASPVDEAVGQ